MPPVVNIKTISYLTSQAAQIAEDLKLNGNPFYITQNGEVSMVVQGIKQYREKEDLIAALKVIAMGEKDRLQGKAMSIAQAKAKLTEHRQKQSK